MSAVNIDHAAPPDYMGPPTPDPARFGLFSVANMVTDPTMRYEAGLEWEPIACGPGGIVTMICPPDPDVREGIPLVARDGEDLVTVLPFAVTGSYLCSAFSRPMEEAENRARQHLAVGEERAAEFAIATGDPDNEPTFAGATDLTPAGGAVGVKAGFGLLEAHLGANYGGVGVIHAPRLVAPVASSEGLTDRVGQRIETQVGTMVAFGGGYDLANIGPDGNTPPEGNAWLYVTSRPQIRRSEVWITPDEDQRPNIANNDVEIFAQRIYSVGWECVTAAVQVEVYEPGVA